MIKTLPELANALNELYPTRFSHFASVQAPPFICYLTEEGETFYADDEVYLESVNVLIEFYTKTKDLTGERKIKEMLKQNSLTYSQVSTFFRQTESPFLTTFSVQLIIQEV